jgi:hypothetical protein
MTAGGGSTGNAQRPRGEDRVPTGPGAGRVPAPPTANSNMTVEMIRET